MLHMEWYREEENGGYRLCYVYTPAGYEKHAKQRYPVLIVESFRWESECVWIHQGKIANMADRLIENDSCDAEVQQAERSEDSGGDHSKIPFDTGRRASGDDKGTGWI